MMWASRGIGISALALALAGGCVADGDSGDDGTGSTGSGDDGGTVGDDGTSGDDGTDGGSGTGGDGGGTGGDGGGTSGTGGTGTGEGIQCGTEPVVFPEFDKGCVGDDDCALVFHTINCCGTDVAWGINVDEVEAFEAAEAICDSQYPGCGCPAGPTEAEDGNTGMGPDDFAVTCDAGTCMSYVP